MAASNLLARRTDYAVTNLVAVLHVGRPITYADDAGMLHSTHNFEIATFTIESDMQELLQGTMLLP